MKELGRKRKGLKGMMEDDLKEEKGNIESPSLFPSFIVSFIFFKEIRSFQVWFRVVVRLPLPERLAADAGIKARGRIYPSEL